MAPALERFCDPNKLLVKLLVVEAPKTLPFAVASDEGAASVEGASEPSSGIDDFEALGAKMENILLLGRGLLPSVLLLIDALSSAPLGSSLNWCPCPFPFPLTAPSEALPLLLELGLLDGRGGELGGVKVVTCGGGVPAADLWLPLSEELEPFLRRPRLLRVPRRVGVTRTAGTDMLLVDYRG